MVHYSEDITYLRAADHTYKGEVWYFLKKSRPVFTFWQARVEKYPPYNLEKCLKVRTVKYEFEMSESRWCSVLHLTYYLHIYIRSSFVEGANFLFIYHFLKWCGEFRSPHELHFSNPCLFFITNTLRWCFIGLTSKTE